MFVDYVKVYVKAGDGGNGCVAFRREKHVPKGGPSGGDGGSGGNIIVKADSNLFTLQDLKYHKTYIAKRGGHGEGSQRHGKDAEDVIIRVPLGTAVSDADTNHTIADFTEDGKEIVVAKGGKGGLGNVHFVTSTNRAPRYATPGKKGEGKNLVFELKLMSDVGLIGLPNAGKSTLISKLSAARPKIADYPFTTLAPNLGIVKYGNYRSFTMVDIPGLIEGAHKGKGLGLRFLRHIERTKILAFLIEIVDPDPLSTYNLLSKELKSYLPELENRPRILVFTKNDLSDEIPNPKINGIDVVSISALTGKGLDEFIKKIVEFLDKSTI